MATDATQATADQIHAQAELGSAAPMGSTDPAQLGQDAAAAGAGATSVDISELLAQLQALQERVGQVEDERAAERVKGQPGIVQRAEQILAQLEHRHAAGSGASPLAGAVDRAGKLLEAAKAAADSGDAGEALTLAAALSRHLTRVGPAAASVDVSYPQQLLDEDFPEAAAAVRPGKPAAPAKPADTFATSGS